MTKSLSNIIKAYSVTYNEKKRLIDMNEKAERMQQEYLNQLLNFDAESKAFAQPSGEFVEGIPFVSIESEEQLAVTEEEQNMEFQEQREENKRMIEAETEQILEEARTQVQQMLEEAKKEAEQIKQDIFEQAKSKGYADGKKRGETEIETLKKQLKEKSKQTEIEFEQKMKEIEPKVADLVTALVSKLIGVIAEEKKSVILYLVEQALLNLEVSGSYIIRVSKEDYELVVSKKAEIQWKLKEGTELEIVIDPTLSQTQCMIETESRIIDCSLDVQLKNLTMELKMLAGN